MGTLIGIGNTVYHGGVGVGSLTPVAAFIANFISGSATPTKGSATYTYTRALTTQTITLKDW